MKSACFTGHRNLKGDIADLSERLYQFIKKSIVDLGLTEFISGGAIGWDLLAAKTVLQLKEAYPQVRLHLVLPCSNAEQTEKWNEMQRKEFYYILSLADEVEYTSEHSNKECMKLRNARMVELATDYCICYYNENRKRSGTGQTVRMAQKKGITIENFYQE